jgi:protein-disulfide isomerase
LVTIVEYSDFQCPFCARLANSLDPVVARYPDVRLVFKQFPLPMHSGAEPAARASLAAHEQGKFWAMHDRLFRAGQAMSEDDLLGYAADVGLDLERFKADFESDEIRDRVGAQMKSGQAVGVNSTPSLFINGSPQRGALPPDALGELIETELAQAKKLVDEGIPRRELYAHMMKAAGR